MGKVQLLISFFELGWRKKTESTKENGIQRQFEKMM